MCWTLQDPEHVTDEITEAICHFWFVAMPASLLPANILRGNCVTVARMPLVVKGQNHTNLFPCCVVYKRAKNNAALHKDAKFILVLSLAVV